MAYNDELEEEQDDFANEKASIATEVIDGLSVAPTELLANEYKRLMEQYEQEQQKRKELEMQIEAMQMETV